MISSVNLCSAEMVQFVCCLADVTDLHHMLQFFSFCAGRSCGRLFLLASFPVISVDALLLIYLIVC